MSEIKQPDALGKLQKLLRELFQIEAASELDFGIYRVIGQKRNEVNAFLVERLPKIVDDALKGGAVARSAKLAKEREELVEEIRKNFGQEAITSSGELADAFHTTPLGEKYLSMPATADSPDELRNSIFNDLHKFFSRYYESGDFISLRRYSKRERYAVPYNGEEVHLHWANADQYYIKSGNHFLDYAFDANGKRFAFALKSAKTEQNDIKESDRRFIALPDEISTDESSVIIPFEWRPLSAAEKTEYGTANVQEKINAEAKAAILAKLSTDFAAALPEDDLIKHLNRYARKNSADFFVHKDLDGFLTRELDFFIKNEILDVDALLAADNVSPDILAARMEGVRAMRRIAKDLISFLAQIENFQKRVFEKKKFVAAAHYCTTLDRVPDDLLPTVAANEAQHAEWDDLYATKEIEATLENANGDRSSVEWLRANPHLVLDTKHFGRDFEDALISSMDDLDESTDGLIINADNFQALNLISSRYHEKIKCVYIDPPYNTGSDGFIYKDRYQHSTWLTMMDNRLR